MQKIQFKNPIFNPTKNLTCRKGIKWSMFQGSELEVVQTGHEEHVQGYAKITDIKTVPFDSIDDDMLLYEHDPSCRTFYGLLKAMQDVYPNFDPREIITMIFFDYKESYV